MKRMIITGATGLLGPVLLSTFADSYKVTGIYLNNPVRFGKADLVRLDLTDKERVFESFSGIKPEIVIHAAAITNMELCEEDMDLAIRHNVDATRNILEACKELNAKIVYISTDYVFDGEKGDYTEKDAPNPLSFYAKTKHLSEKIVIESGIPYLIVRTAFYGWNLQNKQSFVEWVVSSLKQKKGINVVHDQFTSMMFVNDFAHNLKKLVDSNKTGIYHLASDERISKYDLALKAADVFGLDKSLIKKVSQEELFRVVPGLKAKRPLDVSLDASRFKKEFGQLPGAEQGLIHMKEIENIYKRQFSSA